MKKLKIFIVAAIVGNTMLAAVASAQDQKNYFTMKDSCWWQKKIDSIQVDYILIADSSGSVRKQEADLLVRRYEVEQCAFVLYPRTKVQNEVYLLNNVPVDIIYFRRKGGWSSWQ
jgi:hypothetical protein